MRHRSDCSRRLRRTHWPRAATDSGPLARRRSGTGMVRIGPSVYDWTRHGGFFRRVERLANSSSVPSGAERRICTEEILRSAQNDRFEARMPVCTKLLNRSTLNRFAGLLSSVAVRCWMGTLEYRAAFYDPAVDPADPTHGGQKIYVFWHEYILFPFYLRGHCN